MKLCNLICGNAVTVPCDQIFSLAYQMIGHKIKILFQDKKSVQIPSSEELQ